MNNRSDTTFDNSSFLPLDQLSGGHSDKQGLFRPTKSALGRTGLNRWFNGRKFFDPKYEPLMKFIDESTDKDTKEFCEFSSKLASDAKMEIAYDRIYSFDTSEIYNTLGNPFFLENPLAGAHADLKSSEEVQCEGEQGSYKLPKRVFTYNFLYNFTKHFPFKKPPHN